MPIGSVDVVHRERAHEVGRGVLEHRDLLGVIGLRLVGAHQLARLVAVAARADIAGDHHRRARRLELVAQVGHHRDGLAVDAGELLARVAELLRPVEVGAPGGALQHEAQLRVARELAIARVVAAGDLDALVGLEQVERREQRQLHALVEDQRGFHAGVGEKNLVGKLRQVRAILCNGIGDVLGNRLVQDTFSHLATKNKFGRAAPEWRARLRTSAGHSPVRWSQQARRRFKPAGQLFSSVELNGLSGGWPGSA